MPALVLQSRWCDARIGGGGRGPGSVSGAGGLPGATVVAVGAVLLLLLSLVSGFSLMFFSGCSQGCLVQCIGLFPLLQYVLGASCRCWPLGAADSEALENVRSVDNNRRLRIDTLYK